MNIKHMALDALKRQLAWHEDRKKELSKSGRSHAAIGWEMFQHSEEIDDLTIIIASLAADIAAKVEPNDFDLRGKLAEALSCWHRLTEQETDELIAFCDAPKQSNLAAKLEPVTQDKVEALAHRRCKRYIMIDDAPYQFDSLTLMDFVADISASQKQAEAPGWISVSDRLPECDMTPNSLGVQVLVYPPYESEGTSKMAAAFYGCRQTNDPNFYLFGKCFDPTHWMPLPAAPRIAP